MKFDWSSLILSAGMFNILMLLGYVLFSGQKLKTKRERLWFSIMALSIAIILFESIIRGSRIFIDYPYFLFISTPIYFFIQPALLFYQAACQNRAIRLWPHLILPLLNLLIMLPTFAMSGADKLDMFQAEDASDPVWIVCMYLAYFSFYQYRLFKSHRSYTKNLEAAYSQNDLEWNRLSGFITAAAGLALFTIPAGILFQYLRLEEEQMTFAIKAAHVLFSTISHVLLIGVFLLPESRRTVLPYQPKPTKNEDLEAQKDALKIFVSEERVFLDNQLSLIMLADQIGWSRSQLSTVINRGFDMNFYDFINGYRLQEFEKRIKAGEHRSFSLDHLVEKCGFTNYVSFYRFVKRKLNTSPSGLINQIEAGK